MAVMRGRLVVLMVGIIRLPAAKRPGLNRGASLR